jgi:broad specificity phosphatase PhoE
VNAVLTSATLEPIAAHECLLYLVRHGATANNLATPPVLQGCRANPPLSAIGLRQARETAIHLAACELSAVYSSPLLRARQTAIEIATPRRLPVTEEPVLIECDVGWWEGLSWRQIAAEFPDAHRRFHEDPSTYPYLGGETLEQVRRRVIPFLDRLLAGNLGRRVVVVAHNVVNRVYLAHCLGVSLARARSVPQANCGVNLLRYADGSVTPLAINLRFQSSPRQ